MAEHITRKIQFRHQASGKAAPADMHVTQFSPKEQKIRALKSLFAFWLIAAVCILIPIAHFLLVPGFLIGGVIVASRRWKTEEEGSDASGPCPVCSHSISIDLDKNAELPQWHDCPECAEPLELKASETEQADTTDTDRPSA